MSHTYAILEVPGTVYAAVRALLARAGYDHAFHDRPDGERIDMHGIALRAVAGSPGGAGHQITVGTLLSGRTKMGRVELRLGTEVAQLDIDKARELAGMLAGAIEAAMTDQMLWEFLTQRLGVDDDKAAVAMVDFRELRQGSRGVVHPS